MTNPNAAAIHTLRSAIFALWETDGNLPGETATTEAVALLTARILELKGKTPSLAAYYLDTDAGMFDPQGSR